MNTLWQDIRYGLRTLRRSPGFTAIAILAMALGIGANTAIFSVLNAVLLRQLPYKDPDRLGMLWLDNRRLGLHEDLTSYPNYQDWRDQSQMFEAMSGFAYGRHTLTGSGEPERVGSAMVPANFFAVLGVPPRYGRAFLPEEEQEDRRVVIISEGLWKRRFGGDPAAVGKTLELDGRPNTVIGVMPAELRFPQKDTDVWAPLVVSPQAKASRGGFWMHVVGRVKPGVTWEQARTEMSGIGRRLEEQYPQSNTGYGVWVVPLHAQIVGAMRPALLVLFGAVIFVLLIACANVANLLLARAAGREREIAIRAALGAGRRRLIRQLLTESTVLSVLAGTAGLLLAFAGIRALVALGPRDLPRLDEIGIDGWALGFTFAVSVLTGILFGLAPALQSAGARLSIAGGRQWTTSARRRFRSGLVIGEIAMALVLLAGAGLMIRSFMRLRAVDLGFRPENILAMEVVASRTKFPEGAQVVAFYEQALERIRSLPGVQSAGAISDIFLSSTPNSGGFTVEGAPPVRLEQQIEATVDGISPTYFQAMAVPLLKGRFFTGQDGRGGSPVVIVNDTMARRFWPNQDPVGKRFKFGGPQSTRPWLTIVGVAGDMRRQGLEKQARSETFQPLAQRSGRAMKVVIRASGDPMQLAAAVRGEIRSLDKDAPILGVTTIERLLDESVSQRRFQMLLLALFSSVALALATIGIYGVIYHSVAQRTHEIGVRMALGAERADVLRLVIGQGLRLAVAGVALGIAAAIALTRLMESLLYGVKPTDPVTLVLVSIMLGGVAAAASYIPARRATRVDAVVALRYE